jgi:DNA-binding NtrC family response regulator
MSGGSFARTAARSASIEAGFEALLGAARGSGEGRLPTLREWVELAEAWRITRALHEARGNRSAAARSLGIGRRTLYAKMEKLGIEPLWSSRSLRG